jgi:hypothetical protein
MRWAALPGPALALGLAVGLSPAARAEPMQVLVVKRAGITAYEEVTEEFGERCRVRARVVSFGDDGMRQLGNLRLSADDVVVTVGQEALDALRGSPAHIIPTLAFELPHGLVGPPASPPPELILRLLRMARGQIQRVGVVYGPRAGALVVQAQRAAERLGVQLVATRADSGPEAVRVLRRLAPTVDALWLPGDTDVITPQVFQYALRLQLERGLPVAAATRQQVHSGALLAADFSPRDAGRIAAELANRVLGGGDLSPSSDVDLTGGARVTINTAVARRLGIDTGPLVRLGARLE